MPAILLLVILVAGWRWLILQREPAHAAEIARAHGYVGLLYGLPQANADGSKLVYSQMDDGGIGVFLLNLSSGSKVLVHQKVSTDDWFQNLDVWPWSPDGKHFLFTHTNLFVCDGVSGQIVANLPVEGLNGVVSVAWLNPQSFVYVSRAGNLHWIEEGKNDVWREKTGVHIRAGAKDLTSLAEDTICWESGNYIWRLNLNSGVAQVLFHAQTNQLEDFYYQANTRQFLVNCTGKNGNTIREMVLGNGGLEDSQPMESLASAHSAQYLGDQNEIACISSEQSQSENRFLEIWKRPTDSPIKLFDKGSVDGIAATVDGRKLFVVGAISNEPASSIWEYNSDSGQLQGLVAGEDHPSPYAQKIQSEAFTVNLNGGIFTYHVYQPLGLNPNAVKKYPVVIGDTLFKALDPAYENRVHGPYWAPMLANAGAYVVIVERPGSWGNQMDRWGEYVDWVTRKMLENPTIDPKQAYLYATSAETRELSNYVKDHPAPWRGLILLSPSELPDIQALSKLRLPPKIYISQGAFEGTNHTHQYQADALRSGVRVELYTHANNAHILLGKIAMGQRAESMMNFVFGD